MCTVRVSGIKNSSFSQKDIEKIVAKVEKYLGCNLLEVTVVFYANRGFFGRYTKHINIVELTPEKIKKLSKTNIQKGFGPSEKVVLAHEVVHAIQHQKEVLGSPVCYKGNLVEYYEDSGEFEAQDTAIILFGTKEEKEIWKTEIKDKLCLK